MPVLQVRGLPQKNPERVQKALKAACLAIAGEYGCEVGQVWATWQEIQPGHYVEGDRDASMQPAQSHPPIASLLCFEGKESEVISRVLLSAGRALSEELGIPDNIFITYEEAKSGRVISGNGIVRK
jgi:hypothetical protein